VLRARSFVVFRFAAYKNPCYFAHLVFGTSPIWQFFGFVEMNLIWLALLMCAGLPHFCFSRINFCSVYCSKCCALDPFVIFRFAACITNLCYFAHLLFGISPVWRFVGFVEMNLIWLALPMCVGLPHFCFSRINFCFVYCSKCCVLDQWFLTFIRTRTPWPFIKFSRTPCLQSRVIGSNTISSQRI